MNLIPKQWKLALKDTRIDYLCRKRKFMLVYGKHFSLEGDLENLSSKFLYKNLLAPRITEPICEHSWNGQLQLFSKSHWRIIWTNQTILLSQDRKLSDFNFKIIHRILPSGINLCRWRISNSDKCSSCNVPDTYEHMFLQCQRLGLFWDHVQTLLSTKLNIQVIIDFNVIVFGYKPLSVAPIIRFINMVTTIAKYCVFAAWANFNNDPQNPKSIPSYDLFHKYLSFMYKINQTKKCTYLPFWKRLLFWECTIVNLCICFQYDKHFYSGQCFFDGLIYIYLLRTVTILLYVYLFFPACLWYVRCFWQSSYVNK